MRARAHVHNPRRARTHAPPPACRHPDKNAGSRESHDMMPRINAAKDRIDRGGRHDDYADDDYDEDEDYYSDEDEDYYSDDYEFEFGPFASGRMDFGEFLRM